MSKLHRQCASMSLVAFQVQHSRANRTLLMGTYFRLPKMDEALIQLAPQKLESNICDVETAQNSCRLAANVTYAIGKTSFTGCKASHTQANISQQTRFTRRLIKVTSEGVRTLLSPRCLAVMCGVLCSQSIGGSFRSARLKCKELNSSPS